MVSEVDARAIGERMGQELLEWARHEWKLELTARENAAAKRRVEAQDELAARVAAMMPLPLQDANYYFDTIQAGFRAMTIIDEDDCPALTVGDVTFTLMPTLINGRYAMMVSRPCPECQHIGPLWPVQSIADVGEAIANDPHLCDRCDP